ncbi:MAG: type I 3-dehydroquinate dehydratase [Hespellia sp.]|nr:type I 3-dehydroquinate dehydratase [Hespellia sp.]
MRKSIMIREMELGAGKPKICVPITGKTETEILKEAKLAKEGGADLVEWRVDHFVEVHHLNDVIQIAKNMREILEQLPILFTFRTEGCDNVITQEEYMAINEYVIRREVVDMIDIELFMGDEVCQSLSQLAHEHHCVVVISNHDFEGTPNEQVIVERLCRMRELGADVPKIAVMPHNAEDVLTLLSATNQYANVHADGPLITMSMNDLGKISRVSGEIFGSALTFGSTVRSSAPGQMHLKDVEVMLDILHTRQGEENE